MESDGRLELFFSQSLDGFFFMMLDEPVKWDETVDKEAVLDYVFSHQRVTKVNDAMLAHYGVEREQFLGRTPTDFFRHNLEYGRKVWRDFFDRGRLHIQTDERRFDGTPIEIEGDYLCFYDAEGRITGHFGIQRDVSERKRAERTLEQYNQRLQVLHDTHLEILASRSPQGIARATVRQVRDLIKCRRVSVAVFDLARATGTVIASHGQGPSRLNEGAIVPLETVGVIEVESALNVPLIADGELIGVLIIESADERTFEPEEIEIAHELGNTLAVAINQAQLREQVERYAAELEKRVEVRTAELQRVESENVYLQEELKIERNFGEIVGASPAMQRVFKNIELVAATDSTVLILGETGTGKELIARAIHTLSRRKQAVMVKVNCGALPSALAESELFGHERGAFTGAVQQKKGRFEVANHGTIFLDEVGELSSDVQVKLLRVLQEQEVERLGGTQTLKVNVRVIAATNRDLHERVRAGEFRADLFYRLNIFPIEVPPLRERAEDVPWLARHFVKEFAVRMGRPAHQISMPAMERLASYDWPGNVRELANVLERAVILCQGETVLEEHLGTLSHPDAALGPFQTLEEMERQHILRALEKTGGVLAGPEGAARLLGMSRSTVWSRMRKLGIQPTR
jgi:PAS domain S-box-containing protein